MGYETKVICKEVHLPITMESGNGITLEEYKNRYGIDLTDILEFNIISNTLEIRVKPFYKVWIYSANPKPQVFSDFMGYMVQASNGCVSESEWASGVTAAETKFGAWDDQDEGFVGLYFSISQADELDIKNIKVKALIL